MTNTLTTQKKHLRKTLLSARESLAPAYRKAAEQTIARLLHEHAQQELWTSVGVFLPWRAEPDLSALWVKWSASGMALALPAVVQAEAPLLMCRWQPGEPLVPDAMGLMVPKDGAEMECQVWLVPCVAIDTRGGRLGAGKGFYDRTRSALQAKIDSGVLKAPPKLIGVCFDLARTDQAFAESHDLVLDACVTETGWHEFQT
jgi:5-formyltetrahydrofolate cyclo-ligase